VNVSTLTLSGFRNHAQTSVAFSPRINILAGLNGAGKTNLLDALHVLFMSKSFVSTTDAVLLQQGAERFSVEASLQGMQRAQFSLQCTFSRAEGKHFFVNKSPLEKLTDLIGMVPVVVLSPDDRKLTKEGPVERRAFLDAMISQVSKGYLMYLLEYRRVLKHRNRLLTETPPEIDTQIIDALFLPWDTQLARIGASIIRKRTEVIAELSDLLSGVYNNLALEELTPEIRYRSEEAEEDAERTDTGAALYDQLLNRLTEKRLDDLQRGSTSVGPHRDELVFSLGGRDLRKFGSQGQHRLFAIALKMAQLEWFSRHLDEPPVLILDDMFGELDTQKTRAIAKLITAHPFQTFISVAKEELILPHLDQEAPKKVFVVENGQVHSVSET
jgi:DNA replication and repair protein RecF